WSQELTSLNVHNMPVQREGRIRKSSGIREGASCVNRLGGTRMPVEFPVTDDFLYVVGLWLAEGGKSATTYGVTAALSTGGRPGAVDPLSRFFLAYGVTPSKSLANDVDYSVCSAVFDAVFHYLGLFGTARSGKQRFPPFFWDLSQRQRRIVVAGLWDGDGAHV